LNDVEWNLLSQLGRECGGSKSGASPWDCLSAVASALGYEVTCSGNLKVRRSLMAAVVTGSITLCVCAGRLECRNM